MIPEQSDTPPGTDLMAALNATGVPATLKRKVQRAIFRFIAGGMGSEYWTQIRDNLDTMEGRTRVNMMLAEHVGKQAIADPQIVERAKARFLGDLARRQENVEAIARLANDSIEASPDAEQEEPAGAPEPSEDWMNAFIREAENASSNNLRQRLANVLAGEARKPGTFSRATVRFIAEADKETLEAYTNLLKYRFGDAIFIDKTWQSGERFNQGSLLEDAGILSGVTGTTHKVLDMGERTQLIMPAEKLALVFEGALGTKHSPSCWLITRLGMEVASLLPPTDEVFAANHVAKIMPKSGITSIWIGALVLREDGIPSGVRKFLVAWSEEADEADPG
jgi:hypothetical protein